MGSSVVRFSEDIVRLAGDHASINSRSIPKQIEHWVKIGKVAEENPDLPYEFIKGVLEAHEEIKRGEISKFEFRDVL